MKEINVEAKIENLNKVVNFVNAELDNIGCPDKAKTEINLAIDELFSNIANYAYNPNVGKATIKFEVQDNPKSVVIVFLDNGVPYDPLKKEDPNVSLSLEEREIGGLGIFMVKKIMDAIEYEYKDKQNILKIKKNI